MIYYPFIVRNYNKLKNYSPLDSPIGLLLKNYSFSVLINRIRNISYKKCIYITLILHETDENI